MERWFHPRWILGNFISWEQNDPFKNLRIHKFLEIIHERQWRILKSEVPYLIPNTIMEPISQQIKSRFCYSLQQFICLCICLTTIIKRPTKRYGTIKCHNIIIFSTIHSQYEDEWYQTASSLKFLKPFLRKRNWIQFSFLIPFFPQKKKLLT